MQTNKCGIWISLLLLGAMLYPNNSARVEFYEEFDFKGELYEYESKKDCQTLRKGIKGSIRTTGCIQIFHSTSCAKDVYSFVIQSEERFVSRLEKPYYYKPKPDTILYSWQFGPPVPPATPPDNTGYVPSWLLEYPLPNTLPDDTPPDETVYWSIRSFKDCTPEQKDPTPYLDHFESDKYIPTSFTVGSSIKRYTLCGCINIEYPRFSLPAPYGREELYSNGKCVKVHFLADCKDNVDPNYNLVIPTFNGSTRSFSPCKIAIGCRRLKASLFNIEKLPDASNQIKPLKEGSRIVHKAVFNDGTITYGHKFIAENVIEESAEMEFTKEFREIVSESFDLVIKSSGSIKGSLSFDVPKIVEGGAAAKLFGSGTLGFSSITKNETVDSSKYGRKVTSKKTFRSTREVHVPPCTKYESLSTVQIAENVEIKFRFQYEITGVTLTQRNLTSQEIMEYLKVFPNAFKQVIGHTAANNFTVIAETNATLRATYGVNTIFRGEGTQIEDCIKRHTDLCSCKA